MEILKSAIIFLHVLMQMLEKEFFFISIQISITSYPAFISLCLDSSLSAAAVLILRVTGSFTFEGCEDDFFYFCQWNS